MAGQQVGDGFVSVRGVVKPMSGTWLAGLTSQAIRLIRGALRRLLGLTWVSAVLYERNLINEPLPEVKPKVPFEIIRGELRHVELLRSLLPSEKIRTFEQRLREDKVWLLAFVAGELAYSTWISFEDDFETTTGTWVRLAPGETYLFDSFTIPQFRGLGLHTAMTAQRMSIAKEHGAQSALVIVLTNNAPARRVMTKLGCRERERTLTIGLLGRRFVRRFSRKDTSG